VHQFGHCLKLKKIAVILDFNEHNSIIFLSYVFKIFYPEDDLLWSKNCVQIKPADNIVLLMATYFLKS